MEQADYSALRQKSWKLSNTSSAVWTTVFYEHLARHLLVVQHPPGHIGDRTDILRNFDPPGIGSVDIRECLLFQLELEANKVLPPMR